MVGARGEPPPTPQPAPPSTPSSSSRHLAVAGDPQTTPRASGAGLMLASPGPRLPTVAREAYDIAGKFAQGGIGRILRAHDPILGRTVALKELLIAGNQLDEERFIREVLLTARLQHPGIVPVYAAGRWPSGAPFYAMKLVSGRSFDRVIADARTLPARLALLPHVLAIAETVAYAHAQGIIHRDLKPGNVLVGEFGETVVIDWGLAKQLGGDPVPSDSHPEHAVQPDNPHHPPGPISQGRDAPPHPEAVTRVDGPRPHLSHRPDDSPPERRDDPAPRPPHDLSHAPDHDPSAAPPAPQPITRDPPSTAQLTRVGAVVGTPGYMSPEQADGAETDARTDVFALGAILYHTLTGRLPYEADNIASLIYKTVYEAPVPLQERVPDLPHELVAIVEKAMARTQAARYPTAKAFADDLRRFQTGQIVGAHHYTAWEHLVRLVRRYRTQLAIAAFALVVIVVVAALSFKEIREERDRAVAAEAEAVARLDTVSFEYARQRTADDPAAAIDLLAGLSEHADWRRIRQVAAGVHARGLPRVLHGHTAAVSRAVFSPDSQRLVTTSDDCTMRVWDLDSGESRAYYGHTDEVLRAAWSPDLRRIATSSRDRTVRIWDVETGAAQVLRGHVAGVRNLAFSTDGRTFYSSDDDEHLRRWDLADGTGEVVDHCGANNFPWTERVIGCMTARSVILHDLRTGARTVLPSVATRLNFNGIVSPDERWIAAGTHASSTIQLWDRAHGTMRSLVWPSKIGPAPNPSREMRFSPDSRYLAAPLSSTYLGVWDLQAGGDPVLYHPNSGYTRRTAFSADGALLATVGGDNKVKIIDRANATERALVGTPAFLIDAQFSRDGHHLASVGNDPRVFLWPESSFRTRQWRVASTDVEAVAADAPHQGVLAVAAGTAVAVVDETTLEPRARFSAPHSVMAIALRPDASELTTLGRDGEVHVWDARSGAHLRGAPAVPPGSSCAIRTTAAPLPLVAVCTDRSGWAIDPTTARTTALAPRIHTVASLRVADRDLVVLGGEDGGLSLWDPANERTERLHQYSDWVEWITVIPDTPRILVASDRSLDLWDLAARTRVRFPDHPLQIEGVDVSVAGRRVATASRDNFVRVFDLESAALQHLIAPGQIIGEGVHLSTDGDVLAADLTNGTLMLWDLASSHPGEPRELSGATRSVIQFRFTADATALVGVSSDGRVLRWDDDLPRDPDGVRRWVREHHDPRAATAELVPGCATPP